MREWRIKAIQEKDLIVYARKLQAVLNRMEVDGFEFTVDGPGANMVEVNGDIKFLALITGSRDKVGQSPPLGETLVVEEK